jgi:hypothetical protein
VAILAKDEPFHDGLLRYFFIVSMLIVICYHGYCCGDMHRPVSTTKMAEADEAAEAAEAVETAWGGKVVEVGRAEEAYLSWKKSL